MLLDKMGLEGINHFKEGLRIGAAKINKSRVLQKFIITQETSKIRSCTMIVNCG